MGTLLPFTNVTMTSSLTCHMHLRRVLTDQFCSLLWGGNLLIVQAQGSGTTSTGLKIAFSRRRYASKVAGLRSIFSEYGLIRFRIAVECRWLQQLSQIPEISEVPPFSEAAHSLMNRLATHFTVSDAQAVKKVLPCSALWEFLGNRHSWQERFCPDVSP